MATTNSLLVDTIRDLRAEVGKVHERIDDVVKEQTQILVTLAEIKRDTKNGNGNGGRRILGLRPLELGLILALMGGNGVHLTDLIGGGM